MMTSRVQRIAEQLRQEIATIVQQELKHPGLGFVTITRVELTNDARYATVSFSCLGDERARTQCLKALEHSTPFIHNLIKRRFRLRIIPELRFRYDPSIAGAIALEETLDRIADPAHRPPSSPNDPDA